MKKRIGTIYGKPIVEGDENLLTQNELHENNLISNSDSYIYLKRYKAEDLSCLLVEADPEYSGSSIVFKYIKDLPMVNRNDPFLEDDPILVEVDGFNYETSKEVFLCICPKEYADVIISELNFADYFRTKVLEEKEDDDHSVHISKYKETWNLFSLKGSLDEDEGNSRINTMTLLFLKNPESYSMYGIANIHVRFIATDNN